MAAEPFGATEQGNPYIWAQFSDAIMDDITVAANHGGFTDESCKALIDHPLEATLFLTESDFKEDVASHLVFTEGDPATITLKTPLSEFMTTRLATQEQLIVSFLERRGGLYLLRLRAPLRIQASYMRGSFSFSETMFEALMPWANTPPLTKVSAEISISPRRPMQEAKASQNGKNVAETHHTSEKTPLNAPQTLKVVAADAIEGKSSGARRELGSKQETPRVREDEGGRPRRRLCSLPLYPDVEYDTPYETASTASLVFPKN